MSFLPNIRNVSLFNYLHVVHFVPGDLIRQGTNACRISICDPLPQEVFFVKTFEQRQCRLSDRTVFLKNICEASFIGSGVRNIVILLITG